MTRRIGPWLVSILVVGTLLTGCGGEERTGPPVVIDERAGTVEGVGIGDSSIEIKRRVDGPSKEGDIRVSPDGLGFTGNSMRYPRAYSASPRDPIRVLRLDDRSFVLTRASGTFAVFVWSPNARTQRGVEVGDPLDLVRERYPGARCGTEIVDDVDEVPSCLVTVGRRTVAFSKDPIEGMTLATRVRE